MLTKEQYRDRVIAHKLAVKIGIQRIIDNLFYRGDRHDDDKLDGEMLEAFHEISNKFEDIDFGSQKYEEVLESIKPILDKHYEENDHHPQHHKGGISGMNFMSMLEMLVDWKSASSAYGDTPFEESMMINKKRFGIDEQLYGVMLNTAKSLGYIE